MKLMTGAMNVEETIINHKKLQAMMDPQIITHEPEVEKKSDVNVAALALVIVWAFLAVSGIIFWAQKIF